MIDPEGQEAEPGSRPGRKVQDWIRFPGPWLHPSSPECPPPQYRGRRGLPGRCGLWAELDSV